MALKRLAVIGGGAKAAAISAKAACLNFAGVGHIEITIFEEHRIGAAWRGDRGFTDGVQRLCTPAERDVGFPYSDNFGEAVAAKMVAEYSWQAFLISNGRYGDWVDTGRDRPTHSEFADYLQFCVTRSRAIPITGEVVRLIPNNGFWTVEYKIPGFRNSKTTANEKAAGFDGVVVTGAPEPIRRVPSVTDSRIFDGRSFWSSLSQIPGLIGSSEDPVVIVGSGGTAAAIAGWFARALPNVNVRILGSQPALYARTDNAFENRAFRDPEVWAGLSAEDQLAFCDRLTRGAVWSNVLADLSRARKIDYLPGKALRFLAVEEELQVEYSTSANTQKVKPLPASILIEATGFDVWWFNRLFDDALRNQIDNLRDVLSQTMTADLCLPIAGVPNLHASMLSQAVSPAFASLMALGDMADAVLRPYVG